MQDIERHRGPLSSTAQLILLLLIILIGSWLRLHQITEIPPEAGHDPAFYGLDAIEILQGKWPVYFATNFGREALFSYLVALFYTAVGVGTFGIRLAAAFSGIIALPLVAAATKELGRTLDNVWLKSYGGVIASGAIALSFWHVIWSRYGVRAILIPPFVALTIYLLLRVVRRDQWRDWVLLGFVLGVGIYTYQVAQLLPVMAGLCLMLVLWRDPTQWRLWLAKSTTLFLTFLLTVTPLLRYIMTQPSAYNQRVRGVALVSGDQSILDNVRVVLATAGNALLTFGITGDLQPVTNVAGRPTLNAFLFVALLLGLLVALRYWQQIGVQLLLISLFVMLLPAFLADQGPVPKRAIGTLPIVAMLIALGLVALIHLLHRWGMFGNLMAGALLLGGAVFTTVGTYRDYFQVWGGNPILYSFYQVDMAEIGRLAAVQSANTKLYLSPHLPTHPSVALTAYPRTAMQGFNGRNCLPFDLSPTQPVAYILDPEEAGDANLAELQRYYADGHVSAESVHQSGRRNGVVFSIPAGSPATFAPQHVADATWDNGLTLVGWDQDLPSYAPGQAIHLSFYFGAERPVERNATLFVHLIGSETNPASGNNLWTQYDKEPCFGFFPTTVWQDGVLLRDTVQLFLPPDIPSGTYDVAVGWYLWPELQRLPLPDGTDSLPIGTLEVAQP